MKRSWMGVGLLLILLAGSIAVTWTMDRIHCPMEQDLNRAARYAMEGDWNHADALFRRVRDSWQKWEHFRACFADHNPMEEIDGDLKLLETYCEAREEAAFAAESSRLARKIAAMGEAHAFVWWNIL